MRTYEANVANGILTETLVSASSNHTAVWGSYSQDAYYPPGALITLNATCLSQTQKASLRQYGYDTSQEVAWIPYNLIGDPNAADLETFSEPPHFRGFRESCTTRRLYVCRTRSTRPSHRA